MRVIIPVTFLIVLFFKINLNSKERQLVDLVNVFYGANTVHANELSTGNQFPVSARPFGMNLWSVTTNGRSPRFYKHSERFNLKGIRCSHQSSVWIGDYSYFDIIPSESTVENYDITPSRMLIELKDERSVELAPTKYGAIVKFKGVEKVSFRYLEYDKVDDYTIIGKTRTASVFAAPEHTILKVVINSNTKIDSITNNTVWTIGTSFIDIDTAFSNAPKEEFDEVVEESDTIWNSLLSRVKVTGNGDLEKFYSILFRVLLFPTMLKESTGLHYSPYDGGRYDGDLCTSSGFWDNYRSTYPLLHLIFPDHASNIMNGWVNTIKESSDNLLPQWSSPGPIDSMEGTTGEISIAEGIMNNAIYDVDTAWSYLYRSSLTSQAREDYNIYNMIGFVPGKVSLSLNYYLSDYVVSKVAYKLGHNDIADQLYKRSQNWKLLFDRDGMMMFRPKTKAGKFESINQYKWMGPYREGSAWQYRFYVPHNPEELNYWGYDGDMCKYLIEMFENKHKPKNLRNIIHEEKEMYSLGLGQYSHNNQPVHHVPYMFHHVGCLEEGQLKIREILEKAYTNTGYSGDEDNGEMSAWYILSSVGLYSLVPGSMSYQISSAPMWDTVDIDHGRILIENHAKTPDGSYSKVLVNGKETNSLDFYDSSKKYRITIL